MKLRTHHQVMFSSQTPVTKTIRDGSPLLGRRIDEATAGLAASFAKQLLSINQDNAETIVKYILLRFFKWLYYPDIEPDRRSKPYVIENIPRLRRKETSIYKPSDLWTQQDDLQFLKD